VRLVMAQPGRGALAFWVRQGYALARGSAGYRAEGGALAGGGAICGGP